ncbi:MAG: hypothetical protein LBB74_09885 [Chitinispirillales bacterium]|jgi:hypothetical protein|nr:hypothetical protein [Chitinispirillales bacterium]
MDCKHTNTRQVSADGFSGQVTARMTSEIAPATQTMPPDTPNGCCDCRNASSAASADTFDDADDAIISYKDSGYDDYDDYFDALHGTAILRDTLIPISKDFAILYTEYNEKLELWYKLHIVNLNKKDTVRVAPLYDDDWFGSELGIHEVSPNLRYVMLDRISKGFVSEGMYDPKPFLHETYSCMIVDMEKAEAVAEVNKFFCEWKDIDSEEYSR